MKNVFLGLVLLSLVSMLSAGSATMQMMSTSNATAEEAADELLAKNPYTNRDGQQELNAENEKKAKSFFKESGTKIKEIAYAGGKLTWRGVKKAAKIVRTGLGFGASFAGQIFRMVVYYCVFNKVMSVVSPRI